MNFDLDTLIDSAMEAIMFLLLLAFIVMALGSIAFGLYLIAYSYPIFFIAMVMIFSATTYYFYNEKVKYSEKF